MILLREGFKKKTANYPLFVDKGGEGVLFLSFLIKLVFMFVSQASGFNHNISNMLNVIYYTPSKFLALTFYTKKCVIVSNTNFTTKQKNQ